MYSLRVIIAGLFLIPLLVSGIIYMLVGVLSIFIICFASYGALIYMIVLIGSTGGEPLLVRRMPLEAFVVHGEQ